MSGLPNPNKEVAEVLNVAGAIYGPLNESRERLERRRTALKLQCVAIATFSNLVMCPLY